MELWRTITYWWVGINVVFSVIFSMVAIAFGGVDLARFLKALAIEIRDDTDDGRVDHS